MAKTSISALGAFQARKKCFSKEFDKKMIICRQMAQSLISALGAAAYAIKQYFSKEYERKIT